MLFDAQLYLVQTVNLILAPALVDSTTTPKWILATSWPVKELKIITSLGLL